MKTWFLDNDKIDHYSLLGRKISILYFHGSVHIINDTPKTYHRIYHNLSKVPIKTLGRKNYIFLLRYIEFHRYVFVYLFYHIVIEKLCIGKIHYTHIKILEHSINFIELSQRIYSAK